MANNPQLSVKAQRQTDYYGAQSVALTRLITTLGVLIAFLMALGAIFGALNTRPTALSAQPWRIKSCDSMRQNNQNIR